MDRRDFLKVLGASVVGVSFGDVLRAQEYAPPPPLPYPRKSKADFSWHRGIVHCHSKHSDGRYTILELVRMAEEQGLEFLFMTDHYDGIPKYKGPHARYENGWRPRDQDKCWADYDIYCRQAGNGKVVVLPGYEVATLWRDGKKLVQSHTLILSTMSGQSDRLIDQVQLTIGGQKLLLEGMKKAQTLTVAAHPELVAAEIRDYRYDTKNAEGVSAVEFFNSSNKTQEGKVVSWYLSLIKKHIPIFVTSGCDLHGWADSDRWQRITWIYAKELDQVSVVEAFTKGFSYATDRGAKISSMNHRPGFSPEKTGDTTFGFSIDLGEKQAGEKSLLLYRDGEKVIEAKYGAEKTKLEFFWDDVKVTPGEHWYVLYVPGYIITSPIVLDIQK